MFNIYTLYALHDRGDPQDETRPKDLSQNNTRPNRVHFVVFIRAVLGSLDTRHLQSIGVPTERPVSKSTNGAASTVSSVVV